MRLIVSRVRGRAPAAGASSSARGASSLSARDCSAAGRPARASTPLGASRARRLSSSSASVQSRASGCKLLCRAGECTPVLNTIRVPPALPRFCWGARPHAVRRGVRSTTPEKNLPARAKRRRGSYCLQAPATPPALRRDIGRGRLTARKGPTAEAAGRRNSGGRSSCPSRYPRLQSKRPARAAHRRPRPTRRASQSRGRRRGPRPS